MFSPFHLSRITFHFRLSVKLFVHLIHAIILTSYESLPSRILDNCDEHREHTLHPGTIEMSKDNKSSAFPRDASN